MDGGEIVVSFMLSEEEARRETEAVATNAGASKLATRSGRIVALLWLAIGCSELSDDHTKSQGWLSLALGIFYGATSLAQQLKLTQKKITPDVDTTIRFSEAGIFFERPAARSCPWDALRSMRRSKTAYFLRFDRAAIEAPLEPEVAVPLRALGENRIALWELAERMMLGPLRPVSAQLSIDRNGGLRRNDAGSIGNYEALRRKNGNPA